MAANSPDFSHLQHTGSQLRSTASSAIEVPQDMVPELMGFCLALGMDPSATNELEKPDIGFLQEIAKLPIDFTSIPAGTNTQAMRKWIDEVYLKSPLAESRKVLDLKRKRSAVPVSIHDVRIACGGGEDGGFNLRVYNPQISAEENIQQLRPAVLMFHGGGWIHGSPIGDEEISKVFASELRSVVLGVDYRLAPEWPFPKPLDDCCEALRWVTVNASHYGIDPDRIALWGCSAGGNLAAAVALTVSQIGGDCVEESSSESTIIFPRIRQVNLVVPVTAHPDVQIEFDSVRTIPKSQNEHAMAGKKGPSEAMIQEFRNLFGLYVPRSSDVHNPLACPLLARPNSSHPRTHITVAACDYLCNQGLAYAQLLRVAGVEVDEELLPGVPHGFTLAMKAEVTKIWLENQVAALMKGLGDEEL